MNNYWKWAISKKLPKPYVMLFDLHGMDERLRTHREGLPAADFSVFYHLISIDRNRDIMLKVALAENDRTYRPYQIIPKR